MRKQTCYLLFYSSPQNCTKFLYNPTNRMTISIIGSLRPNRPNHAEWKLLAKPPILFASCCILQCSSTAQGPVCIYLDACFKVFEIMKYKNHLKLFAWSPYEKCNVRQLVFPGLSSGLHAAVYIYVCSLDGNMWRKASRNTAKPPRAVLSISILHAALKVLNQKLL